MRAKSVTEQQRWNEHQQEQFRIDLDMDAAHRPCERGAHRNLQDRQRHPQQPHQRAGNGDEDEHDEDKDGGLHGAIPAVSRTMRNRRPRVQTAPARRRPG
jgi:hypothetical protein